MVIWISGLPGAGKSTLAKYYYSTYKKKIRNLIIIDGDDFRKSMNNDLGFSVKDREINALRLTKLVKNFSDQKVNVVISANLIFQKYRNWCKKNISHFLEVYIETSYNILEKRVIKKKFLNNQKTKKINILGRDIHVKKPTKPDLVISNNLSKRDFVKKVNLINYTVKKKRIKIF
jgi:adenylylsulfate kinase-like enzyme